MKLTKILNEIYPQAGGQGERILHKDLMPYIKGIPGTEDIQDWLEQNGDIPEYMIPRLAKDPRTLKFLKTLLPRIKQAAQQRRMNPQNQPSSLPTKTNKKFKLRKNYKLKDGRIFNIFSYNRDKNEAYGYEIRNQGQIVSNKNTKIPLDEFENNIDHEVEEKDLKKELGINLDRTAEKIKILLRKSPGISRKHIGILLPRVDPQLIQQHLDEMEANFEVDRDPQGGYHLSDTFSSF